METEVEAGDRGVVGDEMFHEAITAAAHSSLLAKLMHEISGLIRETRIESLSQEDRPRASLEGHRRIAEAVRDRMRGGLPRDGRPHSIGVRRRPPSRRRLIHDVSTTAEPRHQRSAGQSAPSRDEHVQCAASPTVDNSANPAAPQHDRHASIERQPLRRHAIRSAPPARHSWHHCHSRQRNGGGQIATGLAQLRLYRRRGDVSRRSDRGAAQAQPSPPDPAGQYEEEIAASDDKTSSDHFWSSPPLGIDTKAGVARLSWRRSINPTAVTLVFRSLSPIGADGLSLITSAWFHGHPAPAALPIQQPIITNYVRNSSTTALTAKSSGPAEQCSAPGRCRLLSSWVPSVGAGCARGRGFDVEEYAQRIYRANINLVLAEVPRDYSKPAQAPDF